MNDDDIFAALEEELEGIFDNVDEDAEKLSNLSLPELLALRAELTIGVQDDKQVISARDRTNRERHSRLAAVKLELERRFDE